MPEKVDLIERVEGHVGINIEVKDQGRMEFKFGIKEGPRLFEKFLEGRSYTEVPFFVTRICGFCPIVHNLSAIKAIENILDIHPSPQVRELRRALHAMEFIQSHSAHLYMLTLPDFVDNKEDIFSLQSERPETIKKAIKLRKDINEMIETLGGRTVHPLSTRVGGFSILPSKKEIQRGLKKLVTMKAIAKETIDLISNLEYPQLDIPTHYLAIERDDERYPLYDGHITTSQGKTFNDSAYSDIIQEKTIPYSASKFSYIDGEPYLTGALSRMNLHKDKLHNEAKRKVESISMEFPSDNPFHNNVAQAIEILHCIEEVHRIYKNILDEDLRQSELLGKEMKEAASLEITKDNGVDSVEAPRGTLFHSYELDEDGFVQAVDILTPTAQSAASIEQHINSMVSHLSGVSLNETMKKIKTLVRAYDPCISCSVH